MGRGNCENRRSCGHYNTEESCMKMINLPWKFLNEW
jgi:hypothetical protein